ncbi:MAG: TlpA disulfide reductase family protein [Bacteroidia bacterium]|nr:TlpA disulfide reductase family protein [Bacteroidia bacterium]
MRNIIIILLLVTIAACSSKKKDPGNFLIEGNLVNSHGNMISLNDISSGRPITIDSVRIDEKGNFYLQGKTLIPAIYILHLAKDNFAYLLIEPREEMKIKSDARNIQKFLSSEGSKGTQLVTELWQKLGKVQERLDSLKMIYEKSTNEPDFQSVINNLNEKSRSIVSEHQEYLKKFIRANTSSLASIIALYQPIGRDRFLDIRDNYIYYRLVDSVLVSRYPNSTPVKALHLEVENQKNKLTAKSVPGTKPGIGDEAPEISLPDPDGKLIALTSLRGKYILLDFWASWCRPCRMENPNLNANFMKYYKKGFDIFQVSLDRSHEDWINAIEKDKLTWKHVSDLKYWDCVPAKQYGVESIPCNYLIDPDGKIIARDLRGTGLGEKLKEIYKF